MKAWLVLDRKTNQIIKEFDVCKDAYNLAYTKDEYCVQTAQGYLKEQAALKAPKKRRKDDDD